MILSVALVVSVLSLSGSHALTLNARQDDCAFGCPETDADGNGLSMFSTDDTTISCSYAGEPGNSCTYDTTTGTVIGDSDGCIEAVQQCSRQSRQLKQAVVRRGVYDGLANKWDPAPGPSVTWKRRGAPSSRPKPDVASPTWDKGSHPWSKSKSRPSPSPTPTGKYGAQPPKEKPCDFKCPQKDLAKNLLTDEDIKDSLLCSYTSPDCECKYSKKTGLLLEDNDEGKCPQAATPAGSHPGRDAPSPTSGKGSHPWSNSKSWPSPSPTPTGKYSAQPQKQKQWDYRCPQKDLAKNLLTDETIRDGPLFCSYSSPDCKSCSFCKYSAKTGLLLEDNDDGNCPQTATAVRPWDRRYI